MKCTTATTDTSTPLWSSSSPWPRVGGTPLWSSSSPWPRVGGTPLWSSSSPWPKVGGTPLWSSSSPWPRVGGDHARHLSSWCDFHKVMKVVRGHWSVSHCKWSDTRPSILLLVKTLLPSHLEQTHTHTLTHAHTHTHTHTPCTHTHHMHSLCVWCLDNRYKIYFYF